jgi:ribonucleoside-diphosphate reductase alpha chain
VGDQDFKGVIRHGIESRKFMPGGRYLYASGRPFHQTQNCLLLRAHDSREGWAEILHKAGLALMTGAGIGIDYSDIREEGRIIKRTGGLATGPIALMQMVNECGRGIMQGGSRRSAIWAGLKWNHPDVFKFCEVKNWRPEVKALKEKEFSFPATLDQTNISVLLDDRFFAAYRNPRDPLHAMANNVYWLVVRQMLSTAEPGFSIDVGENAGETLRNACTEVTSRDSDDICNLGSLNMGAVDTLSEFKELVCAATAFLLAGTVYSDVPYHGVDKTRAKNRRLGLGLMGIHEWLLKRGKKYGPDEELGNWLGVYQYYSRATADIYSDLWGLSRPVKVRAIAPTGTISIVAETSSGIEPIFCVAYKRRYLKNGKYWAYQYVVDPVAKRLIDQGVNPGSIEDAYSLANDIERRVKFQSWVQKYVDHGISSTINLPHWGSELNNEDTVQPFGQMLMQYLPTLRGVTCYPDGSRGGQPLVPVPYEEAVGQTGVELIESSADICSITGKGSCGE